MNNLQAAHYRFRIARGFLREALLDVDLHRWRSTVDNPQLAVENAAKSVLALVGPVGRTHNPAIQLRRLLGEEVFLPTWQDRVCQLAEYAEVLGADVHIQTDYGNESEGRTPWELFDEEDAQHALIIAQEAVTLSEGIIAEVMETESDAEAKASPPE